MIDKNKVLSFIKEKGPLLPKDIVKQFGGDTFITGAILSTMVDSKEIKISSSKIGGSPVYYISGQEERLSILFQYLPGKEKEAYTLLKEMKLIKDSTTEPAIRVALRNIKDFAKPIEVNLGETKEIFWKWHLFPNQDAERAIREFFLPKNTQEPEKKEQKKSENKEEQKEEQQIKEAEQKQIQKEIQKSEEQKPLPETKPKKEETETKQTSFALPELKKEKPAKTQRQKPEQKKLIQQKNEEIQKPDQPKQEPEDLLIQKITKIFAEKGIDILEKTIIKKNTEADLVVLLPTPIGKIKYFCKARDKKKTNEKDVAALFVDAQMKKMPMLYLTTGEVTKKANELIEQEFKTITIMHI